MTEQANPCLPGCHPKIFGCLDYAERQHAPACPNAPKASEAPKVDDPRYCNCPPDDHTGACNERMEEMADDWAESQRKPAPAPKASEAPGYAAPVSVLGHADKVRNEYLALRARLAEVEAENEEMSVDYNTLKAERDALRAELAAAREEIARFSHHLREQMEATKAQFSRADRADAWAEQLEDVIVEADRIISTDDYPVSLANIATAIIATRQKEESNG